MWHCSISGVEFLNAVAAFAVAEHVLRGVGDARLGEWRTVGEIAVHVRRRLTMAEMKWAGITGVLDVRGTPEHAQRINRVRPFLPAVLRALPVDQLC